MARDALLESATAKRVANARAVPIATRREHVCLAKIVAGDWGGVESASAEGRAISVFVDTERYFDCVCIRNDRSTNEEYYAKGHCWSR